MAHRIGLVAAACLLGLASQVHAAPIWHAGEWRTTIDKSRSTIVCFESDQVLDKAYVMRSMAKLPRAKCQVSELSSVGAATRYVVQCVIGAGGVMTTSGTITQTAPDSFISMSHSHGGSISIGNGQTMSLPDIDMTTESRRLGPCKPGDRTIR